MTAPDVRTAAQTEADKLYPLLAEVSVPAISKSRRLRQKAFIKGAVWGAALVTPTRGQIAEVLYGNHPRAGARSWADTPRLTREVYLEDASTVLRLLAAR